MSEQKLIDVTAIEPSLKHSTIFDAFDSINAGDAVVISNDHDPKPLYYQMLGERGNCFSWTYLVNGPEIWKIEIKKNDGDNGEETIGELVAKDIRKAEVFKKFGIDFCCGGKKTVDETCAKKGIDVTEVKKALDAVETRKNDQHDFDSWKASFLSDYIVNIHHTYVSNATPILGELSKKVASRHGGEYPYLVGVSDKTEELLSELTTHMKKEEQVLFPYIKALEANGGSAATVFKTIQDPIWMMESDHDAAGDIMRDIRALTNDYTLPEGACNSFSFLIHKLEEFENDLHTHIHLENNVLFPKALLLEKMSKN